ncbi:CDP-glucose 4,6-dehydratase [Flavobacteriaceae bacterium]|nr:CDP-glucose 4,6-dehydratase [Flavobacteriaceae bacterium]
MDKMGINKFFDNFFQNKKVLVTGHTGFKGSWLCIMLNKMGADVYGYALEPPTNPSLFKTAKIDELLTSYTGDIRDYKKLSDVVKTVQPELVIHMAAQPLVRESYINPIETYEVNVMGTVSMLEACRNVSSIKAIINVTTDKCYENKEWYWGYRENEAMGGYDPYSSSKGCSELVTASLRNSFYNLKDFENHGVTIASVRAGNVIGGGDWASDRLIPDFIRAISKGQKIMIRNPFAVRPWQHVLEPLTGYLLLAKKMIEKGPEYSGAWNFGSNDSDIQNVEWITKTICEIWGTGATYSTDVNPQPYEANYLKLDCSKAKSELGWEPSWNINQTLKSIVDWNKAFIKGEDMRSVIENQTDSYFS